MGLLHQDENLSCLPNTALILLVLTSHPATIRLRIQIQLFTHPGCSMCFSEEGKILSDYWLKFWSIPRDCSVWATFLGGWILIVAGHL